MLLKNSFGIPRRTQVILCWLYFHISRIFFFSSLPPFLSLSLSLSLSCVFYCKLRLKSLARSQAFHLGRCIPPDTHEHYMLAYVSRARTRTSRSRIREEKSFYMLPAGSKVRFTCTHVHT